MKKMSGTIDQLLHAVVYAANIQDSNATEAVISKMAFRFPIFKNIFADGGYRGELKEQV